MNRGQSEVLGFVFVFALIVGSVGLVYTTGYPALEDAREAMATNNVEKAFEVLNDNLHDIQRRGAPSRATEIRLAGGELSFDESTTITISVENKSDSTDNSSVSLRTRPLVYEDDGGRTVAFEEGGTIRGEDVSSAMVDGPSWTLDSEQSVILLTSVIPSEGPESVSSKSTVLVTMERKGTSVPIHFEPGGGSVAEVNITVESDRPGAWQQYFERKNGSIESGVSVDDDASDGAVSWRFETERLYVTRTGVSTRIVT